MAVSGPTPWPGLRGFSHIEVIFHFDRVPEMDTHVGARHPPRPRRLAAGGHLRSSRAKARPNPIGITICRLLSVEGLKLKVRGLDAIDGTPVLDIKPVMKGFLPRGEVTEPVWAQELMKDYWARTE